MSAQPTGGAPAISLQAVHKSFGSNEVIRGIDLEIQPGEVVAFLGPNGAGKTTTLDMVMALSEPNSGTVQVYGMKPRKAVDQGLIAALTQTGGLLPDTTAYDHVRVMAELFGYGKERADFVIKYAGIQDIAKRKTKLCSGGEKQRIKFAMALVTDPQLLILDEPTAGMDVNTRRVFWETIHDQATAGRTVLFATHYLEEADQWADRVIVLVEGHIIADGSTAEIRSLAAGRTVTAEFDNNSEAQKAADSIGKLAASVKVDGITLKASTSDSDALLRFLLNENTGARNLEVTSQNLESAFIALTEGEQK
jgi:ABC-2 type transport system ATP-binding protein